MGLLDWLFPGRGKNVKELGQWLDVEPNSLKKLQPDYRRFTIPKKSGGVRHILAPADDLKRMQRRILRRLLSGLRAHDAAHGFERGRSIVTNARVHRGQDVVVNLDLVDFFPSTQAIRVFRYIGWNRAAAKLLLRLCTHEGGLPRLTLTLGRLERLDGATFVQTGLTP